MLPLNLRPHGLYRFFDATGHLLYIGITADLPTRLGDHNEKKPWWTEVASVTVEHYPDRPSVLQAEKAAIKAERPRYNIEHNEPALADAKTISDLASDLAWVIADDAWENLMSGTEYDIAHGYTNEDQRAVTVARAAAPIAYRQLRGFAVLLQAFVDKAPTEARAAAETAMQQRDRWNELTDWDRLIELAREVLTQTSPERDLLLRLRGE